MSFGLRPYQREAMAAVLDSWREFDRVLLVLPTGAGKTVVFAQVAKKRLKAGRVLILAHREELLNQAADKLQTFAGLDSDLERAEHRASREAGIVIASVQTLRGDRLANWAPDHFATIIVDEAHHGLADGYQAILEHFDGAKILGVTATPDRGDKRALGEIFETIAYEIGLPALIDTGYLSRITAKLLPLGIELGTVRSKMRDYVASDLDSAIVPFLEEIAGAIIEHASDRKTLVFLPTVQSSRTMAKILAAQGTSAEHVDGTSTDRRAILERFSGKESGILTNCLLLTEGFDEPGIDCIVNLRPTRSRPLYQQMVGRGTRIFPSKRDLLLLDFLWQSAKHSLVRPASLIATDENEANRMTRAMRVDSDAVDLAELKEQAEADRLAMLKKEIEARRAAKPKTIDPIQWGAQIDSLGVVDFEAFLRWHEQPVTPAQQAALAATGFDPDLVTNRGHASAILDAIGDRRRKGLATPKQMKWLVRMGHRSPASATFEEASAFLDARFNRKPALTS